MTVKIHFMGSLLDFCHKISAKSVTNKVKDFHQCITTAEKQYQGNWTSRILADYWWTLKTGVRDAKYRRNSFASKF